MKFHLVVRKTLVFVERLTFPFVTDEPVWAIGTGLVCGAKDASKYKNDDLTSSVSLSWTYKLTWN